MPRTDPGLEYFPLDVDIDTDDKIELIEAKHGITGFAVIIRLFMKIYRCGYYYKWGEKEQLLFSKRVNVDINTLNAIINDAIGWEIFDEGKFNKYEILTSKGIQKRYTEATKRRQRVELYREYLLMNGICLNAHKNIQIVNIKDDNADISTQSKVKESKAKESKQKNFAPPTIADIKQYCKERNNKVDAETFHDFYSAKGWMVGKNKMKDWRASVRTWERRDNENGPNNSKAWWVE